jgi:hypothetical protein
MIESIIIILLIIAVLLLILAFFWESLTISIVDTILWLTLAISMYSVEIPYQYESGGVVVEATQSLENMYPIGWLFMGLAIIMMIHTFLLGFELFKGRQSKLL